MAVRRRKRGPRRRSPVPPPGRVIDRIRYPRAVEKERLRRQIREELQETT